MTTIPPSALAKGSWEVPYYVKGLALGLPIYFVAIHMWTWILSVPVVLPKGGYDFRQIYAAAYMVRTGHAVQLYDYEAQRSFQNDTVSPQPIPLPYVSPAYEGVILAPLSWCSFRTAYFLFLAINLGALGICYQLLRPWMINLRAVYAWLPAALFFGFLPTAAALIEGQDSALLTACLVASWVFLSRGRQLCAGVMMGAALFKFSIVLPLAVFFLFWRRWRLLIGFALAAACFAAISVSVTGISQTKLYVHTLLEIAGLKPPVNGLALYPVSWQMMANAHGFVFALSHQWTSNAKTNLAAIFVSAVLMAWTVVKGWRIKDAPALFLLAVPCSVLISHHAYSHDLSVLLLPMLVLLDRFLPGEQNSRTDRRIACAAVLMFVAPVMESYSRSHFYVVAIPVLLLLVSAATAARNRACGTWQ